METEATRSREEIVLALFDLFRRAGYEGVSIGEISAATGLGRSSLYHYFPGGKADMAAAVIRALMERYPQVPKDEIDDVILGCAMPEGEQGMNMARIAALRAGLPDVVPGVTINRFCSSGLQAIAMAAERIRAGMAQIILAGGAETMSLLPMTGRNLAPNPWMVDHHPEIYINMGLTAENVAEAVRRTKAPAVDVSSGVEERPGVKSIEKIAAFLAAAKQL